MTNFPSYQDPLLSTELSYQDKSEQEKQRVPLSSSSSSYASCISHAQASSSSTVPSPSLPPMMCQSDKNDNNNSNNLPRTGRWSLDEKILFLYGLRKFGKGRWKKISIYLPKRSLVQIKSHAQKVLKRMEDGENIYHRLDDNCERMEQLVSQVHERYGEPPIPSAASSRRSRRRGLSTQQTTKITFLPSLSITTSTTIANSNTPDMFLKPEGQEDILAASALCQLAGPATSEAV